MDESSWNSTMQEASLTPLVWQVGTRSDFLLEIASFSRDSAFKPVAKKPAPLRAAASMSTQPDHPVVVREVDEVMMIHR